MNLTKFKMSGREYVILPRKEYERVAARLAEDERDAKRARKALAHFKRTGRGVTLEQLKAELGD